MYVLTPFQGLTPSSDDKSAMSQSEALMRELELPMPRLQQKIYADFSLASILRCEVTLSQWVQTFNEDMRGVIEFSDTNALVAGATRIQESFSVGMCDTIDTYASVLYENLCSFWEDVRDGRNNTQYPIERVEFLMSYCRYVQRNVRQRRDIIMNEGKADSLTDERLTFRARIAHLTCDTGRFYIDAGLLYSFYIPDDPNVVRTVIEESLHANADMLDLLFAHRDAIEAGGTVLWHQDCDIEDGEDIQEPDIASHWISLGDWLTQNLQ